MRLKRLIQENEELTKGKKFLYYNPLVTEEEYFYIHPKLRAYSFNTRIIINILKLTNYSWSIVKVMEIVNKIAEEKVVNQECKDLYLKAIQLTVF